MPCALSRDNDQVELRTSTSISPDCNAIKRSLADSGENLTLAGSLKIAEAIARQKSTSKPVQFPLSSGLENPGRPWLTPHISAPRSCTFLRVWAELAATDRPSAKAAPSIVVPNIVTTRFMIPPLAALMIPRSSPADYAVRLLQSGRPRP